MTIDSYNVTCKCGNWEEQDADSPHKNISAFKWMGGNTFICKECYNIATGTYLHDSDPRDKHNMLRFYDKLYDMFEMYKDGLGCDISNITDDIVQIMCKGCKYEKVSGGLIKEPCINCFYVNSQYTEEGD